MTSVGPTRSVRLHLVRHGQTYGNTSGALDTGEPGLDLTPLGKSQALAAAEALGDAGIGSVHVSNLVRTHQTAAPFLSATGLQPQVHSGLREIQAGDFEMRSDHEAVSGYITTVASWILGDLEVRMPGAESGREFLERYDAALVDAIGDRASSSLLVVSHGAAIRTWVSIRVPGADQHPDAHGHLHNTACIVVEGHPDTGWELIDWHADPLGGHDLEDPAAPDPTADAGETWRPSN